jgi:glyoxalase family protein
MQLEGIHHVTAITGQAVHNVDFYTRVLGMRLVKKTVNQDDISAYHLYYADAFGTPGTNVTFFDWPAVVQNRSGSGSIARISLRVQGRPALDWWAQRLSEAGIPHQGVVEVEGIPQLRFNDPEGLELALLDDLGQAGGGTPWEHSPVPSETSLRGLYAVTLRVKRLEQLALVMTRILGFQMVNEYPLPGQPQGRVAVFSVGPGGPGAEVHVEVNPDFDYNRLGRGGVHHVAFRTPDDEGQHAWRQQISSMGLEVTPVIDRFYFKSIYFRVPEGILFEIATDGPGFDVDEDVAHLGERLALPPFLEPQREYIEAQLKPL